MKYLLIGLMLFGCTSVSSDQQMTIKKNQLTKWGRYLIDCPTAQVTMTSTNGDGEYTFFITGCGLKICCNDSAQISSCFSCIKKDWY